MTQLQASNAQLQSELLSFQVYPNKNKNPNNIEEDEKLGTNSGVSENPNKKMLELIENIYDKKLKYINQ